MSPDSFAGRLVDASLAWYDSLTGLAAADLAELGRRAFSDGRLVTELIQLCGYPQCAKELEVDV